MYIDKREPVLIIFRDYSEGRINEDMLIQRLNDLQDAGVINEKDREVLGWTFIFRFRKA